MAKRSIEITDQALSVISEALEMARRKRPEANWMPILLWGPSAVKHLDDDYWAERGVGFLLGFQVEQVARSELPATDIRSFQSMEIGFVISPKFAQLLPEKAKIDYKDGQFALVRQPHL
jgi:hypothetical protein